MEITKMDMATQSSPKNTLSRELRINKVNADVMKELRKIDSGVRKNLIDERLSDLRTIFDVII